MPRFMAHVVTDVEFVGGDTTGDYSVGYAEHLAEALQEAARKLSLRTVESNRVLSVQVGEVEATL